MTDPKPCPEYARCDRPRVWRVTSPADLFHTTPIDLDQAHCSSLTCDHHLGETVKWARSIAGEPEIVALPARVRASA